MKNVVTVFVSLIVALLVSGCDKKIRTPTEPDPFPPGNGWVEPPSPTPVPPVYETLPAFHRLVDDDGNDTKMWVELVSLDPPRGSFIILGPPRGIPDCARGACFRRTFRFGLDQLPNPHVIAGFDGWFSEDGKNPRGQRIFSLAVNTGAPMTDDSGNSFVVFPDFAPQYILTRGSYPGDVNGPGGSFPGEIGSTKFFVDYKPRS